MKKRLPAVAFALLLLALLTITAGALEATFDGAQINASGFHSPAYLTDGVHNTYSVSDPGAVVSVSRTEGIGSIYIVFDRLPSEWTLTDPITAKTAPCGEDGFLHEYVDVKEEFGYLPQSLSLSFQSSVSISEIYVFSDGEEPSWVQKWEKPLDRADLLLISSHSDDEQLFFAGVLPYYAGERKLDVQVAYMVSHFDTHERPHEQLDGLWTVGVKNYPVMTDFPDLYSESKEGALQVFASSGVEYTDFIAEIITNIRRFKPLVVVSHDPNGEYGHGTHILCTSALCDALSMSADPTKYSASADLYGTWTVEKTYLHLYPENPIVLNLDEPLESFEGRTAFQVTQDGFACHKSQHWTWFNRWIYGTSDAPITAATQIDTYSPCNYGLYQSTVGPDTLGGDFFENVKPYKVRDTEAAASESSVETAPEIVAGADSTASSDSSSTADSTGEVQTEAPNSDRHSPTVLPVLVSAVVIVLVFIIALIWIEANSRRRRRRRRTRRRY